jgi:hypothetical protein
MPPSENLGLDLAKGAALARQEMYGDWYRDPWGWPELTKLDFSRQPNAVELGLVRRDRDGIHLSSQPHFHLMEIPKSWLGVRPAVVQDAVSHLIYLTSATSGLATWHSGLPDWVFGWRIRGETPEVRKNSSEWLDYVDSQPTPDAGGSGLQTDITSFFASLQPAKIAPIVLRALGSVASTTLIMEIVESHNSLTTRGGLPQRSYASAIIANAAIQPIDDALESFLRDGRIRSVRRWMDDVSAEGDEGDLYALLLKRQQATRQSGLELNSSKTNIVPVGDLVAQLRTEDMREVELPVRFTANYEGDVDEEVDLAVLIDLEDAVLNTPRGVSRTLIKAVLFTLRQYEQFERWEEWCEKANSFRT